MTRDLIERFRYRFDLWRQERREASFWRFGPPMADLDPSKWNDPKYRLLLTEPTWKCAYRTLGLYFAGLIFFTTIARVIVRLAPSAQSFVLIIFVALVCLWTLFVASGAVSTRRRRKAYQEQANRTI